jgi:uncharacterized protein YraI/surface antigen
VVGASALALVGATAVPAGAISAPIKTTAAVNMRTGPSTSYSIVAVIPAGVSPSFNCWKQGQNVNGVDVWFNVTYGGHTGYYASYYDNSSYTTDSQITSKYHVPQCGTTPPPPTGSINISGTVECNSGAVVGIWIQSSGGGSGFAGWTPLALTARAATYSRTFTTKTPTNIQLRVGCGGTKAAWGSTNYAPTRTVSSSHVFNTWCTVASKTCAAPATGKTTTSNMGAAGNCTWEALKLFHDYEGWASNKWPYFLPSDAGAWASSAAKASPPWSVRAVPAAKAILVFAPSQNHVAWVNSISANGSQLNITEMNHLGLGVVDTRTIAENAAYRFIVAPWKP